MNQRRLLVLMVAVALSAVAARAQAVPAEASRPQENAPLRFVVVGDTGTGDEAHMAVARRMVVERGATNAIILYFLV